MKKMLSVSGSLTMLIVLSVVSVGCGSSTSSNSTSTAQTAAPSSNIAVDLNEMNIVPAPAVGKAGKITFAVTNSGKLMHEMVVVKTTKKAGDLAESPGGEASEIGAVGEVADLPAGKSKSLTLDLKTGHYALVCNIPGHYVAGMYKDFNVE